MTEIPRWIPTWKSWWSRRARAARNPHALNWRGNTLISHEVIINLRDMTVWHSPKNRGAVVLAVDVNERLLTHLYSHGHH